MPTFPKSGVVAFQQVMESWTLSGLVEDDLGLLCCLRGNLAHLGNPSLSFGTPEAVLFLASFLVCHYSLVTREELVLLGPLRAALYHPPPRTSESAVLDKRNQPHA